MKRFIICLGVLFLFGGCATLANIDKSLTEAYHRKQQRIANETQCEGCIRMCDEEYSRCAAKGGFNLKRIHQMVKSGECIRWLTLCKDGCKALAAPGEMED